MRACARDALADARPPLDRHGVRVGDGLQGLPARAARQRDPDRLLPARRRVEAQPLRRRLAAREVHAPLQPELAVLRPGVVLLAPRGRRRARARGRARSTILGRTWQIHALFVCIARSCSERRSSSSASSPARSPRRTSASATRWSSGCGGRVGSSTDSSRRGSLLAGLVALAVIFVELGDRRLRRPRARIRDGHRLHARRGRGPGDPRLVLPRLLTMGRREPSRATVVRAASRVA